MPNTALTPQRSSNMMLSLLMLMGCVGDGLVDVDVLVWNEQTGCFEPETVEWPGEYWTAQSTDADGCTAPDVEHIFERDGRCYNIDGACPDWMNDPEVDVCESELECCFDLSRTCVPE